MNWQRNSIRRLKIILGAAILLVIVATFSVCSVLSLIDGTKIIFNTGSVSTMIITSPSGSPNDIQTSVNAVIAAGGGTVYIPAGDWQCNQTATGAVNINLTGLSSGAWLSIIGSYNNVTANTNYGYSVSMPSTILRSRTINNGHDVYFFLINGVANRHIRISGISFLGMENLTSDNDGDACLYIEKVDGFRVDHCFLDSAGGADILTFMSKGVIDHVDVNQTYSLYTNSINSESSWGYGIQVAGNSQLTAQGSTATWITNLTQVIGLYNWQGINITYSDPWSTGNNATVGWTTSISYTAGPIYIENCAFDYCRHGVTSSQYGYYVVRNCVFLHPRLQYLGSPAAMQYCDIHGEEFPAGRGAEIYDNTFFTAPKAIMLSAGGGVIFNNTFISITDPIQLQDQGGTVGDGMGTVTDLWIWSDVYSGTLPATYLHITTLNYRPGIDYYADVASELPNGTFTSGATSPAPPRPNYAYYTYPHPLTL